MKQKWLVGIIVVLLIAMSGTFGYILAGRDNQDNLFSSNSSGFQLTPSSQNMSLNSSNSGEHTLNVTGVGFAEGKPDSVQMQVGVITEVSKDVGADEAVKRNSTAINQVIESLKEEGISEDDIETSRFDLSVRRDYIKYRKRSEIIGYRVTHMLKVTTSDSDTVGRLIDIAVDSGANEIGSIVFTFSEEKSDELEVLARERAAEDAKHRAEAIADSLGAEITGVYKVSEGYQSYPRWDKAKLGEGGSTAIMPPSSLKKVIDLNVVFTIG